MRSLTRNRLFNKSPFKKALAATVMSAALMTGALANPTGPTVRNGQVNISGLGGSQLQIEQLTNKAIVNWDSFSIGAGEAVRFLHPPVEKSRLGAAAHHPAGRARQQGVDGFVRDGSRRGDPTV